MRFIYLKENQRLVKFILFILPAVLYADVSAIAVPVMPNEAILRGTITEISVISHSPSGLELSQILYKIKINIDSIEDVKDYPNFLRGKDGQSLTLHSKDRQIMDLISKRIKALVEYKGDERGGLFWIKEFEVIN